MLPPELFSDTSDGALSNLTYGEAHGRGWNEDISKIPYKPVTLWLCEAVYFLCTSCSSDALGIPGSRAFRMASQAVFCFQAQKDETRVKSC